MANIEPSLFDSIHKGSDESAGNTGLSLFSGIDSGGQYTDLQKPSKPESTKTAAGDIVRSIGQGVLDLPSVATGLGDIGAAALGFDRPFDKASTALGEFTGIQPKKWADETVMSEGLQEARANIDAAWDDPEASGLDIASAYLSEPSVTLNQAVRSLPAMVVPGGIASKLSKGAKYAGSVAEGATMAGMAMSGIDEDVDAQKAALTAVGVGGLGFGVGALGGKLAERAGVIDMEQLLAQGMSKKAAQQVINQTTENMGKRIVKGGGIEALEEMVQSGPIETGIQNIAEGKSFNEGLARSMVEGAVTGGAMGGVMNAPGSIRAKGPLSRAVGDAQPATEQVGAEQLQQSQQLINQPESKGFKQRPEQDNQAATLRKYVDEVLAKQNPTQDELNKVAAIVRDTDIIDVPKGEQFPDTRTDEEKSLIEDKGQSVSDYYAERKAELDSIKDLPIDDKAKKVIAQDLKMNERGNKVKPLEERLQDPKDRLTKRLSLESLDLINNAIEQKRQLPYGSSKQPDIKELETDSRTTEQQQTDAIPDGADATSVDAARIDDKPTSQVIDDASRYSDPTARGTAEIADASPVDTITASDQAKRDDRQAETITGTDTGGVTFQPTHTDSSGEQVQLLPSGDYVDANNVLSDKDDTFTPIRHKDPAISNGTPESDIRKEDETKPQIQDEQSKQAEDAKKNEEATAERGAVSDSIILTQTESRYINNQLKKEGVKKSSPGYKAAKERAEEQYQSDLERAEVSLPFEEYVKLPVNKDQSESLLKQDYDAIRKDLKITDKAADEVVAESSKDAAEVLAKTEKRVTAQKQNAINMLKGKFEPHADLSGEFNKAYPEDDNNNVLPVDGSYQYGKHIIDIVADENLKTADVKLINRAISRHQKKADKAQEKQFNRIKQGRTRGAGAGGFNRDVDNFKTQSDIEKGRIKRLQNEIDRRANESKKQDKQVQASADSDVDIAQKSKAKPVAVAKKTPVKKPVSILDIPQHKWIDKKMKAWFKDHPKASKQHPEAKSFKESLDELYAKEYDAAADELLKGVKFSKAVDKEVKNLAIIHNLSTDNLVHADKMGGLAVPSIAIVNKDFPLSGFGDISLVGSKEQFAPSKDTKIFDADIYSPTYPSATNVVDREAVVKAESKLSPEARKLSKYIDKQKLENATWAMESLAQNLAIKYTYLEQQGKEPAFRYLPRTKLHPRLRKYAKKGVDTFELSRDPEFIADLKVARIAEYRAMEGVDQEFIDGMIADLDDRKLSNIANHIRYDIDKYLKEKQAGKQVDTYAMDKMMRKRIDETKYNKWIKDSYGHLVPESKLYAGENQRTYNTIWKAHTLENVVRMMKKELQGGEGFSYNTAGAIRSHLAGKFKNIAAIKAKRGKLVSEKDMKLLIEESDKIYNKLESRANDEMSKYDRGGQYLLEDVAKHGWYGIEAEYGVISDALKADVNDFFSMLRDYPTEYFEGKVQRAVDISEFEGAVVPLGKEYAESIELLKKNGITNIRRYKSNDPESRAKAVNGFKKLLFSKSTKTTGSTVEQITNLLPRRVKAMVNTGKLKVVQSVGDLPKKLQKRGSALYHAAFHGGPHDFDKFTTDAIGTGEGAQAYGYGLYFSGNKEVAEWYRNELSTTKYEFDSYILNKDGDVELNKRIEEQTDEIINDFDGDYWSSWHDNGDEVSDNNKDDRREWLLGETDFSNDITKSVKNEMAMEEDEDNPQWFSMDEGKLYEVELAPSQDEYLLWDKPLSEQSDKVKELIELNKNVIEDALDNAGYSPDIYAFNGKELYGIIKKIGSNDYLPTVEAEYERSLRDDERASIYLHSLGIRGIKYLDGSSRGKGEGNYNYVIFSDEDVAITAKYSELDGVEALYNESTDEMYLVADMLNKDNIAPVLNHELFHRLENTDPKLQKAISTFDKQLSLRLKVAKNGKATPIENQAAQRVMDADTKASDELAEFKAYMVTGFTENPDSFTGRIKKIFNQFIAEIKMAMMRMGILPKNLKPADLYVLAKQGAKVKSVQKRSNSQDLKTATDVGASGVEKAFGNSVALASKQGYKGNDPQEAQEWTEAVNAGLDMSKNARMKRAKDMGFDVDTPVYHGTQGDIKEFKPMDGAVYEEDSGKYFFTNNKDEASAYAMGIAQLGTNEDGANIISTFLSIKNPYKIEINSDEDPTTYYDDQYLLYEEALEGGYDGIIIENEYGEKLIVAFNPNQIRSINAAFNPDWKDSGNLLASYAGKKSETADSSALSKAVQMEQDGVDNESIRKETGWFLGMDDKWRFEINDSGVSLKNNSGYINSNIENISNGIYSSMPLDDLVDAKDLFSNYPKLKNITVTLKGYKSGQEGASIRELGGKWFISVNNAITKSGGIKSNNGPFSVSKEDADIINKEEKQLGNTKLTINVEDLKSMILHEIQHAIQDIEGFATGGSIDIVTKFDNDTKLQMAKVEAEIKQAIKLKGGGEWVYESSSLEEIISSSDAAQDIKEWAVRIVKGGEKSIDEFTSNTPWKQYKRLAGEIEARDVQSRMRLTPKERKHKTPYKSQGISKEDAIVRFEGGKAESRKFSKAPKQDKGGNKQPSFKVSPEQKEALVKAKVTVKKFMQRYFTPQGLMSDKVFDIKLESDFMKNVGEEEVQFLSHQLRTEALKAYDVKHYADLPKKVVQEINKELNGEKSALPAKVKETVVAMRAMMDSLSGELQQSIVDNIELRKETLSDEQIDDYNLWLDSNGEQGNAPEDLANASAMLQTIESNKGNYVHRSYQAFDDADWMEKALSDKDLISRAESFIAEQNPELTPSQVSAEVKGILQTAKDKGDMSAVISRGRKQGSKDMSIMKKRKDISPVIRELLGEHKDPLVNFTKSATKMQWFVANHYFLSNVRKDGIDVFLLKKRDTINGVDYIQPVASKSNKSLSPLSGLFTSIDFNNALEDVMPENNSSDLVNQYIKWNSAVKYGKTILSPTTQFRNFMSAGMFAIMSGHFNWTHGKQAAKVMRSDIFTHEAEYHKYIKDLIGKGVLHDNPFAGELRDALNDFYEQQDVSSGTKRGVKAGFKRALEFAQKSYQAGDDFWKIIGYENELQQQLDNGLSQKKAEEKAAYRIRNGYPTYSMVPKGMRWLRRFPLMGTFVSFPYEIVRTSINNVNFIKEDMKTDPSSAAKRVVGMSIASSAAYAASQLSMLLMGLSDEDDEAVKLMTPEWSRNAQFLYMGYDKNGLPKYLDLSSLDPYTYLKKPLSAILSGNNEGITDKLKDAAKEMLDPFLGIDIAAGKIFEVVSNKKESGGSVYNEQDDDGVKTGKVLNHLRKGLQPGVMSNIERMAKAVLGSKSRSGKEYEVSDEMAAFIGFRVSTANMNQSLIYKGYSFMDSKKDAQRILSSAAGTRENISDGDIESAFSSSMRARDEAYRKMIKLSKSMISFGVSRQDIVKSLRGSGVTMKDTMSIIRGAIPKWKMSRQFIKSSADRAMASSVGSLERLKIRQSMVKRKRLINRLANKY